MTKENVSNKDLKRIMIPFGRNSTLQKLDEEYAPIFSAHNDKIYLNSKLYQRIKAIDLFGILSLCLERFTTACKMGTLRHGLFPKQY